MNIVILHGRLTKDPEIRQTQFGVSVCRFTVAVDKFTKDKEKAADFIECTAWRQTAEFVSRYFSKGSAIIVEGQLRNQGVPDSQERVPLYHRRQRRCDYRHGKPGQQL